MITQVTSLEAALETIKAMADIAEADIWNPDDDKASDTIEIVVWRDCRNPSNVKATIEALGLMCVGDGSSNKGPCYSFQLPKFRVSSGWMTRDTSTGFGDGGENQHWDFTGESEAREKYAELVSKCTGAEWLEGNKIYRAATVEIASRSDDGGFDKILESFEEDSLKS